MKVYPSWRYHSSDAPRLVYNEEEDAKLLAQGWADTPAAFTAAEKPAPEPIKVELIKKSKPKVQDESAPIAVVQESSKQEEIPVQVATDDAPPQTDPAPVWIKKRSKRDKA